MTEFHWGPVLEPRPEPRRLSHALGTAARALLITAAVVLVVGGLAIAGFIILLTVGLNSWASNK